MPNETPIDLNEFPGVQIVSNGKHRHTVQRLDDNGVARAVFCPSHGHRCRSGCLGFQEMLGTNKVNGDSAMLAQCLVYQFSIGRIGPVVPRDLPRPEPDAPSGGEKPSEPDADTDNPTE